MNYVIVGDNVPIKEGDNIHLSVSRICDKNNSNINLELSQDLIKSLVDIGLVVPCNDVKDYIDITANNCGISNGLFEFILNNKFFSKTAFKLLLNTISKEYYNKEDINIYKNTGTEVYIFDEYKGKFFKSKITSNVDVNQESLFSNMDDAEDAIDVCREYYNKIYGKQKNKKCNS